MKIADILYTFRPADIMEDARLSEYHREREGYRVFAGRGGDYAYRPGPHPTLIGEVLLTILDRVHTLFTVAWCEAFGHDYRDESYGGPESGCMAATCERCGHSFHHTLY